MLKGRASNAPIIIWWSCVCLFIVVVLAITSPIQVDVCSPDEHGSAQNCGKYQIALAVLLKAGPVIWKIETWTALATIAIAYFTFTLKRATDNLWDASKTQHWLDEDTAKRQLRAYLGIQGGWIRLRNEGEQLFVDATVLLENWGQTPAYNFRTSIDIEVHPTGSVPFTDSGPLPLGTRAHSIIGPRSPTETGRASPISADDLTSIRTGIKTIFVWGRLDYIDCFETPRFFVYRCAASGQEQMRFSTSAQAVGQGWGLAPHPLGYEAN
jgi:hypothetical protein